MRLVLEVDLPNGTDREKMEKFRELIVEKFHADVFAAAKDLGIPGAVMLSDVLTRNPRKGKLG